MKRLICVFALASSSLLATAGDYVFSVKTGSVASYLYTIRAPAGVKAQGSGDLIVSCLAVACEVEVLLGGTTPTGGTTLPTSLLASFATITPTPRILGYAASDATGGTSMWIGYTAASVPLKIPWNLIRFSGSQVSIKITPTLAGILYISGTVTEFR